MRYYDFTLVTSAEQIKEKAKVNLREYGYGSPIAALNCYMDKNTKNDVNFFVYREEEKLVCAAFCYSEQKMSFDDAYDHILGMLNDDFDIRQIRTEPEEITMYRYLDDLTEGKRRDFMNTNYRFVESSNLWIYNYGNNEKIPFHYDHDERIIQDSTGYDQTIYDPAFNAEIANIETHSIAPVGGKDYQSGSMHMIFAGNPGSAKTTVAKLFAGIAKERGILKSGAFVERGGMDLSGLGCVVAIREAFIAAKGGVLFIDEAYSMTSDTAVAVLIQEMENHRDEVIVILAGYNERMKDFLKINEGLKSRIPHWIDFPDYTANELTEIFKLMISERGFSVTDDAVKEAYYIFEKVRNTEDFGNGRYVRNLIDRAAQNQAVRLLADGRSTDCINKGALFRITKDDICMLDEGLKQERASGEAAKELDEMIGLSSVKQVIHKAIAHYKFRKLCMDKGLERDKASMHMVFTGNPGTAKTTVARLFAEILKDEKVLPTGVFVEVGRADLVGDHVGSTAPLVKKKFREAQGGVLFIDEAYSLCDRYSNGFGDEAINTLVQEMENHRDNVIVIFAGYPEPMKQFLERNPGMQSRIAFQVRFDDYDTDELCRITRLMITKKRMSITNAAMNKLLIIYDNARKEEDYGNGRFVRSIIEEAEMNLAERIMKLKESEITTELITTIEECDIPVHAAQKRKKLDRIGFAVKDYERGMI